VQAQAEYVVDFLGAVVTFLGFHPSYADLANRIARAVTVHATPVGSGTVARTKRIPIEERAEAAVIAWMRHQTTGYDGMVIPRFKGKRREVRRMLARRSHELLERYRRGEPVGKECPLKKAIAGNVMTSFDRTKTLQELEGQDWGDPTFESSLVTTCHRLRRKRLEEFKVEDLRIMIGQKIGLPFLVPIALERLEIAPLVEGDFYPGDLLAMVLRVDDAFWTSHPDLCEQIRLIVRRVNVLLPSMAEAEQQTVHDLLRNANRSLTE
jgi:hypothetical protein